LLTERVALSDVVKVSAEDLVFLTGTEDGGALIGEWLSLGVKLLVRTEGARGATAFVDGRQVFVAAPPVAVRDTIGAGDSFMAALLARMAEEGRLEHGGLDASREDAARWLAFAAQAAAVTCSRAGADPPRRAELA
jgi:fructokinase